MHSGRHQRGNLLNAVRDVAVILRRETHDCRGCLPRKRRAVGPSSQTWGASSLVEWRKDSELSGSGRSRARAGQSRGHGSAGFQEVVVQWCRVTLPCHQGEWWLMTSGHQNQWWLLGDNFNKSLCYKKRIRAARGGLLGERGSRFSGPEWRQWEESGS